MCFFVLGPVIGSEPGEMALPLHGGTGCPFSNLAEEGETLQG